MGRYIVEVKPSARKELEALPNNVLARAVRKMESLGENPRPTGCKKLKGYGDRWRIRIGDWRILYIIDDGMRPLLQTTALAPLRGGTSLK